MVLLLLFMFEIVQTILVARNNGLMSADQRHLVTSVKTVLLRHVPSERPLIISLPKSAAATGNLTRGNIQTQIYDVMLQAINEKSQWLLQTTNPEVDTLQTSMKPEVSSAVYIMLISGHDVSNIAFGLIRQLEVLEGMEYLNKRASFFVVMTDSVEFPRQLAEKIIEKLWKECKILDVLLLIPVARHGLKNGNKISDVTSVFNFYTLFPFHSSGNEVVFLDKFFVDAEVESLYNSNLLPNKIPRKFQNHKTLSTMTTEVKPTTLLVGKTTDEMNKTRLEYKGPEVDLFKLIVEHLNLSYEYKVYPPDIEVMEAILEYLINGDYDIMFGSTPLQEKILAWGEPSVSYYQTGFKWYVPCPVLIPRLEKISQIFSPTVWVIFIITFVAVIAVMWLLGKRHNVTEIKDYRTVSSCAYNAWSTAMNVSASQPSTTSMRTLFFLWVCCCYGTSTVFQTLFTSSLVNPGFGTQLESFEDLLSSGLEYGHDKRLYNFYFESSGDELEMNDDFHSRDCTDKDACVLRVINDKDFATLQTEFMMMYFATIYLPKGNLLCTLRDNFRVIDFVMYFPKGSHFLIPINGVIRRITEAGLITKFIGDIMELWKIKKDSLAVRDFVVKDSSVGDYFVFNMSHLQIAFWCLTLGLGLSTICLVLEILCYRLGVVK
jgi:hypothetical protein